MGDFKLYRSKYEELSIKEIVDKIKERNPNIKNDQIADEIGYDRTALSKKNQAGEGKIKRLLVYCFLNGVSEAETSPKTEAKEDVVILNESSNIKSYDISLSELKEQNKIGLARLEMLSIEILQLKDQISNIEQAVVSGGGTHNKASLQPGK